MILNKNPRRSAIGPSHWSFSRKQANELMNRKAKTLPKQGADWAELTVTCFTFT